MLFLLGYLMFTISYFVYGHEYAYFVMNIFGKRSIIIVVYYATMQPQYTQ